MKTKKRIIDNSCLINSDSEKYLKRIPDNSIDLLLELSFVNYYFGFGKFKFYGFYKYQ